jgi:hypothetical protein
MPILNPINARAVDPNSIIDDQGIALDFDNSGSFDICILISYSKADSLYD